MDDTTNCDREAVPRLAGDSCSLMHAPTVSTTSTGQGAPAQVVSRSRRQTSAVTVSCFGQRALFHATFARP